MSSAPVGALRASLTRDDLRRGLILCHSNKKAKTQRALVPCQELQCMTFSGLN